MPAVFEPMTATESKELVDEGYRLTQEIKALTAELDSIKKTMLTEAKNTGVTDFMGAHSKCVITARSTTTIDTRKCYKLMKKQGTEALFWSITKVSVENARAHIDTDFDTISEVTCNPFAAVSFK